MGYTEEEIRKMSLEELNEAIDKLQDHASDEKRMIRTLLNAKYEKTQELCKKYIGRCFKRNDRTYYCITAVPPIEITERGTTDFNEYQLPCLVVDLNEPHVADSIYRDTFFKGDLPEIGRHVGYDDYTIEEISIIDFMIVLNDAQRDIRTMIRRVGKGRAAASEATEN